MRAFCTGAERAIRATKEAQSEPSSVSSRDAFQSMFDEAVAVFRMVHAATSPEAALGACSFTLNPQIPMRRGKRV